MVRKTIARSSTPPASTGRGGLHRLGWVLRGAALLVMLVALGQGVAGAEDRSAELDSLRQTIDRYHETVRLISEEKQDWELSKRLLEDRISLVEREIEGLEQSIASTREKLAQVKDESQELEAENEALKSFVGRVTAEISGMEGRVLGLLDRLPAPFQEEVKAVSQQIPEPGEEVKKNLVLGDRYRNVLFVLKTLLEKHSEVTVRREVHEVSDGRSVMVSSMYVGLSQGYFVNEDGTLGGIGSAGPDAWRWTMADASAADIARAVSIRQGEKIADYVALPVRAGSSMSAGEEADSVENGNPPGDSRSGQGGPSDGGQGDE